MLVSEAARVAGLHHEYVYELIRTGRLHAHKEPGKRWRVRVIDVMDKVPDVEGMIPLREAASKYGYSLMHMWRLARSKRVRSARRIRMIWVNEQDVKNYASREEGSILNKKVAFSKWLKKSGILERRPIPTLKEIQHEARKAGQPLISVTVIGQACRLAGVIPKNQKKAAQIRQWANRNIARCNGMKMGDIYRAFLDETGVQVDRNYFVGYWSQCHRQMDFHQGKGESI